MSYVVCLHMYTIYRVYMYIYLSIHFHVHVCTCTTRYIVHVQPGTLYMYVQPGTLYMYNQVHCTCATMYIVHVQPCTLYMCNHVHCTCATMYIVHVQPCTLYMCNHVHCTCISKKDVPNTVPFRFTLERTKQNGSGQTFTRSPFLNIDLWTSVYYQNLYACTALCLIKIKEQLTEK